MIPANVSAQFAGQLPVNWMYDSCTDTPLRSTVGLRSLPPRVLFVDPMPSIQNLPTRSLSVPGSRPLILTPWCSQFGPEEAVGAAGGDVDTVEEESEAEELLSPLSMEYVVDCEIAFTGGLCEAGVGTVQKAPPEEDDVDELVVLELETEEVEPDVVVAVSELDETLDVPGSEVVGAESDVGRSDASGSSSVSIGMLGITGGIGSPIGNGTIIGTTIRPELVVR